MHPNSELLFAKYAKSYFQSGMSVLEVGPDKVPSTIEKMVGDPKIRWEYLGYGDTILPVTHRTQNDTIYPLESNSYDIVLAANVIEHVRQIWIWVKELARLCRPGGYVVLISLVSWTHHKAPVDCWRVYPDGMRVLFDEAGLMEELARFESLECPEYPRLIPGVSKTFALRIYGRRWVYMNRLLGYFKCPVEAAYDTIAIGRKPADGADEALWSAEEEGKIKTIENSP